MMPVTIASAPSLIPSSRKSDHIVQRGRLVAHSSTEKEEPLEGVQCVPSPTNKESDHKFLLLPSNFRPNHYSVICGRGKKCTEAIGNRRLKIFASLFMERYSQAQNKEEKSKIVSEIMKTVEDACPDERATFIRFSNGRWYAEDQHVAREKVGSLLRDGLHTKYTSSTKVKVARRKIRRQAKQQQGPCLGKQKNKQVVSSSSPRNAQSRQQLLQQPGMVGSSFQQQQQQQQFATPMSRQEQPLFQPEVVGSSFQHQFFTPAPPASHMMMTPICSKILAENGSSEDEPLVIDDLYALLDS